MFIIHYYFFGSGLPGYELGITDQVIVLNVAKPMLNYNFIV